MEARLTSLEAQVEGVFKAQLLLGTVVESGQTDLRRQVLETLPQDITAGLRKDLEAQVQVLSNQVTSAIGEAMANKRHAAIEETIIRSRPLSLVLGALDALEGTSDSSA